MRVRIHWNPKDSYVPFWGVFIARKIDQVAFGFWPAVLVFDWHKSLSMGEIEALKKSVREAHAANPNAPVEFDQ